MFETIFKRTHQIENWQKIPWNDPDFSRRMLAEHLTQAHDAASRRTAIIERQVTWIHGHILAGRPSCILDLGCGPGLYTSRLAGLGHTCTGIDFSPASIDYARQHSTCTYIQGDLRELSFGTGYDLVMMIFGELNTFSAEDARQLVAKAHLALNPGGALLLEAHTDKAIQRIGQQPPTWYSARSGLFSDQPYLCLHEAFYEAPHALERHYIIDAQTGQTTSYGSMLRAYSESEYCDLLSQFSSVIFYPSLDNPLDEGTFHAIVARKAFAPA